jgi:hypothetical protein
MAIEQEKGRGPIVLLLGAAVVVVLIAVFYLVNRMTPVPVTPAVKPLPMGAAEQAYSSQVKFLNPQMSRAANFLNQEVTFMFGTVSNEGPRAIREIEIQMEFHDPFNQIVLRDRQRLFGPGAEPLGPRETRDFQLGYETMPATWNQAYPKVTIVGLDLQ